MYLHIGSETIVSEESLIGIFDLDNTSVSKFTREFLRARQQEGTVVTVAEDIPKSFVLCAPSGRRAPARAGKPARRDGEHARDYPEDIRPHECGVVQAQR